MHALSAFRSLFSKPKKSRTPFKNELSEGNEFIDLGATEIRGRIYDNGGQDNVVSIGKGTRFSGAIEFCGNGNRILIGDNCHFRGKMVVRGDDQTVTFGDRSTSVGVYILCQEGCDVTIGTACMLSREVEIRTTDAHSVIDKSTGRRVNLPAPVTIGDHVWIGVGALISKGARIPSDSIVAAKAFVNDAFEEEGIILAGLPAKIVKRGITWNRGRKPEFSEAEMDAWKAF